MKLIHKFKSPNFNERKSNNINLIIIHYTALKTITDSINYLCDKRSKVSSHYLISKKGEIFNLVSEKKRAWHAGYSYWNEIEDINSQSIGIELDYIPSKKNKKYNKILINSLIILLEKLVKKYKIKSHNILGHSDVSPYRKIDPGKSFPWQYLEEKKISFKVNKIKKNNKIRILIKKWFRKNKIFSEKKRTLFMLNYIGYDISLALINKSNYEKLILMYSCHFKNYKNNYPSKKYIINFVEIHFINILLTQHKK